MSFITLLTGWPALGVVALYFAWIFTGWLTRPQTPGPLLARFSNIWYAYRTYKGHFEKENVELHRKYGKIVRLGPNLYSIDDDAAARTIYGHGTRFIKSDWYRVWQLPKFVLPVNLFALIDVNQHSSMRRQYANLYAMSSLVGYEPYVDNCVDILCRQLITRSEQNQDLDLVKWLQWYAFDVIGEITFSKRFGFMESAKDVDGMIDVIDKVLKICSPLGLFPGLVTLQHLLASLAGSDAQNTVVQFANDRIKEARYAVLHGHNESDEKERKTMSPDFCTKAIALTQNEKIASKRPANVSDDLLIMGTCVSNIFAGSDTTSVSLCATLFNIVTHPGVLAKIRQELDSAAAQGALSDPPTFAETQALPYLQAALKEALRIHPATGLPLWRDVPAGGVTLCGTYFPAGTTVGINSWVAHRNRDFWGPDADEFRPERWLEASEEKLRDMNAMHMPFGLGSRTCIGKNVSLLEISKVIPQLLRKFDFTTVGTGSVLPSKSSWFVKQQEFKVRVHVRED